MKGEFDRRALDPKSGILLRRRKVVCGIDLYDRELFSVVAKTRFSVVGFFGIEGPTLEQSLVSP